MEASSRAHRCTCSDALFVSALAGSVGALLSLYCSAGWLWLWLWLCCSRAGWLLAATTHPPTLPYPLPLPLPLPRPAAPSVPRGGVRVYLVSSVRTLSLVYLVPPPLYARSLTLLYFPRCSPPFVLRLVLRLVLPPATCSCNSTTLFPQSPIPYIHTCILLYYTYTHLKPCALLPSTDQPLPWPARYTTTTTYNREAMFSDCAHGRPTVPC